MIAILTNDGFLKIDKVKNYFSNNIDYDWKIYTSFDSMLEDKDKIDIILNSLELDGNKIKEFNNLKWVFSYSAGIDNYPLKELDEIKVTLTNVSGVHSKNISEQVLGIMIMFSRNLFQAIKNQENRLYKKYHIDELYSKNLMIIGMGKVGRELARRAKAFDMNITGIRNHVEKGSEEKYFDQVYSTDTLDQHLNNQDYIVSILPSTDKTKKLYNYDKFSLMDSKSIFINVGRGDAVVEEDLIKALENGIIKGAYIDVSEMEPIPEDSPLWDTKNLFITPHISGSTPYYFDRAIKIFKENLNRYKNGEKLINKIDYKDMY